jgi:hypothetical protein
MFYYVLMFLWKCFYKKDLCAHNIFIPLLSRSFPNNQAGKALFFGKIVKGFSGRSRNTIPDKYKEKVVWRNSFVCSFACSYRIQSS